MEGWELLAAGLFVFFGVHLIAVSRLRDRLVGAMSEGPWRALVALVTLAGLVLIVIGFRRAPYTPVLYSPPHWTDYIPLAVMLLAFIGLVGAYTSKDMRRITRHPMLWGVALWAAAHLTANGTTPDIVLFGSFLVFALVMQPLADARAVRRDPEAWAETKSRTSAIPFAALIAGRAAPPVGDFTVKAVLHGLAAYIAVVIIHAWLLGVAVAPGMP